jgi:hypothetical protein
MCFFFFLQVFSISKSMLESLQQLIVMYFHDCFVFIQFSYLTNLYLVAQFEFFTCFKVKHPKVPMMFTSFQALKPWFVH